VHNGTDILASPGEAPGAALQAFPIPGEGTDLRVLLVDGEPWFVAADVARVLGYSQTTNALRMLKTGEKGLRRVKTLGGEQQESIINEPGFYRLVMRSNRPEADAFQTWVTGEVLPQIRKTGAYGTLQHRPKDLSRLEILQLALEAEQAREAAEGRVAELLPRAEGYDQVVNADGLLSLAATAQALGMGRAKLIAELHRIQAIMVRPGHSDHLRPYQRHVNTGRFVLKLGAYDGSDGTRKASSTTYVTPKGLDWLRQELVQAA
jgi:anti-repressor protein